MCKCLKWTFKPSPRSGTANGFVSNCSPSTTATPSPSSKERAVRCRVAVCAARLPLENLASVCSGKGIKLIAQSASGAPPAWQMRMGEWSAMPSSQYFASKGSDSRTGCSVESAALFRFADVRGIGRSLKTRRDPLAPLNGAVESV